MSEILSTITLNRLKEWEKEKVSIHFTDEDIRSARITDARKLGENTDDQRIPFSFVLLTELKEAYYEQGTFKVVLPDKRVEYLFMVPIGVDPESEAMRYEVVFN